MPQTVSNPPRVCKDAGGQRACKHTGMVIGASLVSSSPLTNIRHTHVNTPNPGTSHRGPRGPRNGRPPVGGAPPAASDGRAPQGGERRDRLRRGPKNNNRKWRFKAPPLPVRDSEDWEKELLDMDGVSLRETKAPENASVQAVTSALPPGLSTTTNYSPASIHPPPFKWVRHVYQSVDGQFDDAEG